MRQGPRRFVRATGLTGSTGTRSGGGRKQDDQSKGPCRSYRAVGKGLGRKAQGPPGCRFMLTPCIMRCEPLPRQTWALAAEDKARGQRPPLGLTRVLFHANHPLSSDFPPPGCRRIRRLFTSPGPTCVCLTGYVVCEKADRAGDPGELALFPCMTREGPGRTNGPGEASKERKIASDVQMSAGLFVLVLKRHAAAKKVP